jgi:hypothetical protein
MTFTDFIVWGRSVTSPKSGSFSVISSFSSIQSGSVTTESFGTRTGDPSVSNTRGPDARKTEACSSG